MKKTKLFMLTMALISTVVSFTGCGVEGVSPTRAGMPVPKSEESSEFGEQVADEYPLSRETIKKLKDLDSDYNKVNWMVTYSPSKEYPDIVVSETKYEYKGFNHLVVAFTNLSDEAVKITYKGGAKNSTDEIEKDLGESDVELGPKATICSDLYFKLKEPSGDIEWNTFEVSESDKLYIPYEQTVTLDLDSSGDYYIEASQKADARLDCDYHDGFAAVLDKDGNILQGENANWGNSVSLYNDSFGGEDADVVYFKNFYRAVN
ncbi:hypothetical protein [Pseudobutyrivibrio sp. YE44]|uniref:hypothetical protein n=1 Tax=Pseudobutyrivibrio sp. YE44 TaxID=1520802 RepID=UPI000B82C225|nr:hypothetical protein [Pseudobutyrivibrio sp. YE44]